MIKNLQPYDLCMQIKHPLIKTKTPNQCISTLLHKASLFPEIHNVSMDTFLS